MEYWDVFGHGMIVWQINIRVVHQTRSQPSDDGGRSSQIVHPFIPSFSLPSLPPQLRSRPLKSS